MEIVSMYIYYIIATVSRYIRPLRPNLWPSSPTSFDDSLCAPCSPTSFDPPAPDLRW